MTLIDEREKRRQYMPPLEDGKEYSISAQAVARQIGTGHRMSAKHVNKLCRALRCQPADILAKEQRP